MYRFFVLVVLLYLYTHLRDTISGLGMFSTTGTQYGACFEMFVDNRIRCNIPQSTLLVDPRKTNWNVPGIKFLGANIPTPHERRPHFAIQAHGLMCHHHTNNDADHVFPTEYSYVAEVQDVYVFSGGLVLSRDKHMFWGSRGNVGVCSPDAAETRQGRVEHVIDKAVLLVSQCHTDTIGGFMEDIVGRLSTLGPILRNDPSIVILMACRDCRPEACEPCQFLREAGFENPIKGIQSSQCDETQPAAYVNTLYMYGTHPYDGSYSSKCAIGFTTTTMQNGVKEIAPKGLATMPTPNRLALLVMDPHAVPRADTVQFNRIVAEWIKRSRIHHVQVKIISTKLSHEEMWKTFHAASIIIGVHSEMMSYMIASLPRTPVIEIAGQCAPVYMQLAQQLGFYYYSVSVSKMKDTVDLERDVRLSHILQLARPYVR